MGCVDLPVLVMSASIGFAIGSIESSRGYLAEVGLTASSMSNVPSTMARGFCVRKYVNRRSTRQKNKGISGRTFVIKYRSVTCRQV